MEYFKSLLKIIISNHHGLDKVKSIRVSLLYGNKVNIRIYKGAKFFLAKTAKINIDKKATLKIGTIWPNTNFSNSTFNISDNAVVDVKSNFNFQTGVFVSVGKDARLILGSGYTNNDVEINCTKYINRSQCSNFKRGNY